VENFIGQIIMMATSYVPNGYLPCDGRLLPIMQYQALFALLGVTYGGDGKTTFALPNLTARMPIHPVATQTINKVMVSGHGEDLGIPTTTILYCICVQGLFPERP